MNHKQRIFPITQNKFYAPILGLLKDGSTLSLKDLRDRLIIRLRLRDSDLNIKLPSGEDTVFDNRFSWARNDLKRYGYIDSPKLGFFTITSLGISLLRQKKGITKRGIIKRATRNGNNSIAVTEPSQFVDQQNIDDEINAKIAKEHKETINELSPDERIQSIIDESEQSLPETLLAQLRTSDPTFFEQIVNELCKEIFEGKSIINTGGSKDGGIDGVIYEDELGFKAIHVQSKRWKEGNVVGENEIRNFIGSLESHNATRGIFVTASTFHYNAKEVANHAHNIQVRLIDGEQLVKLMIKYQVGVKIKDYKLIQINDNFLKQSV